MTKTHRLLCWILFTGSLIFLRGRSWYANREKKVYDIIELEMADAARGKRMLGEWQQTNIGSGTLVEYARWDTCVDFLFIIGYTGVLVIISARLRKRQNRRWAKALLRWCLPMALLAGLLDVVENSILLRNMQALSANDTFVSTRYIAGPKFALIGFVILIWGVSYVSGLLKPKGNKTIPAN